jgi:hypothetical protein
MRPAASVLLVMALLLTACTATESPTPTAQASTPAALKEIAASYRDLVSPLDRATCDFNVVLSQPAPALTDLKRGSADYVAALATVIDGLRALPWPSELTDDANDLIDALVADQAPTRAMAEADSMSSFITADGQLIEANSVSSAAAKQLRKDLGLPTGEAPCS